VIPNGMLLYRSALLLSGNMPAVPAAELPAALGEKRLANSTV